MKKFLKLICTFLFIASSWAAAANAENLNWRRVHEIPYHPSQGWSILRMDFDINASRGLARAHLLIGENNDGESPDWFNLTFTFPGLSYDNVSHQVVYFDGNQIIPCMTINGSDHVLTGRCDFHSRMTQSIESDGFESHDRAHFSVYFEAR